MFTKLYIANDHGGYIAKIQLMEYLKAKGYHVENLGTDNMNIVRYPYYAARLTQRVVNHAGSGGILICSTGIGMSIIANKFKGIRAALCTSSYMAKMTRLHNDANVLCLGGKVTGEFEMYDIVDNWLAYEYEGGRHDISLDLINRAEDEMISKSSCGLAQVNDADEI